MMGIMDDELDVDTAHSKEDKDNAVKAKASKTWRILRLSSRAKLSEFDKIEDGKNLKILFETPQGTEGAKTTGERESDQDQGTGDTDKAPESSERNPGGPNAQAAEATETTAS
jgi:THO complex subunit 1